MQQAPYKLTQALRTAFRVAKPVSRPRLYHHTLWQSRIDLQRPRQSVCSQGRVQARFYSQGRSEVDKKAAEAKSRIDEAIESRAETATHQTPKLKAAQEETIIHTNPEASSIVEPAEQHASPSPSTTQPPPPSDPILPSSHSRSSPLRTRFASFMDTFQSSLFLASRRLNDLTGYTGIESLKNEITRQESLVSTTRRTVKDARARYASAIATRSTTQREVNDLLHRKHAWTPEDLERFTSLYRSDHANEQVEAAAQKEVGDAEARHEEASTKLGRTILARYHEEQIWSDKIRQMSTWGTWGLMGLNVLLFVLFQIAVEPWRRKRLVKGFEEKVELALKERDDDLSAMRQRLAVGDVVAAGATARASTAPQPPAAAAAKAETVSENMAEHIVDAVTGASPASGTSSLGEVEAAAETVTDRELGGGESIFATTASGYASYAESFRELWSEEKYLVVTQKEMTTHVLEGAVGGAALMGLLMALLRPR